MAAVSTRGLDDEVTERLRIRAAEHGRSLEDEIRAILVEVARGPGEHHLGRAILDAFEGDGVDLEVPTRTTPAQPPDVR